MYIYLDEKSLFSFHPDLESAGSHPVPGKEKAGKDHHTANFPYSDLTACRKYQILFCDIKLYFYDKILYCIALYYIIVQIIINNHTYNDSYNHKYKYNYNNTIL